jgi:hypothetical protein
MIYHKPDDLVINGSSNMFLVYLSCRRLTKELNWGLTDPASARKYAMSRQWWASYFIKVTALLYFRSFHKNIVTVPLQLLVTDLLKVTKLLLVTTKSN